MLEQGLLPDRASAENLMEELLGESAHGTNDPKTKSLRVVLDRDGERKEGTFAHEVVHAIDDGLLDLSALMKLDDLELDQQFARRCVVEGNATLQQMGYMLLRTGCDTACVPVKFAAWNLQNQVLEGNFSVLPEKAARKEEILAKTPGALVGMVLVQYFAGARLLNIVKKRGGIDATDEVFRNPPISSEQVFFPEKYFEDRDDPITISFGQIPAPFEKYQEVGRGTLGVYLAQLVISSKPGDSGIRPFVDPGWEGDRFIILRNAEQRVALWRSEWDSPLSAERFEKHLVKAMEKRASAESTLVAGRHTVTTSSGRAFVVSRNDLAVHAAFGIRAEEADAALVLLAGAELELPEGKREESSFLSRLAWLGSNLVSYESQYDGSGRLELLNGLVGSFEGRPGGFDLNLVFGGLLHFERTPDRFIAGTAFDMLNVRRNARNGTGNLTLAGIFDPTWSDDDFAFTSLLGYGPSTTSSLSPEKQSFEAGIMPYLGIGFRSEHLIDIAEDGSSGQGKTTKTRLMVALVTIFYDHRAIPNQAHASQFRLLWGLLFGYVEKGGVPSWWTPLIGYDSGADGGHLTLFWGLLDFD